jgi:NhaP-type Na+/H+ or K+/H+ antiporter
LGYPFLFIALYALKFTGMGGEGTTGGAGNAVGMWFYETWGYTILLSILYGVVVGWISMKSLHWAEEKKYVDRESFLVFAISLGVYLTFPSFVLFVFTFFVQSFRLFHGSKWQQRG